MLDNSQLTQKHKKNHSGQSMVELALLLPILLVLIISAVEIGRVFFTKIVITNAAREGAYYLATHQDDYNISTGAAPNTTLAAQAEASSSGISGITVTVVPKNCCTIGVYSVEITVETQLTDLLILGFLNNVFTISGTNHATFPLSASVEMMMQ